MTDEESVRLKKTRSAARKLNEILPSSTEFESIPLQELRNRIAADIQSVVFTAEKESGLPLRELTGLDKKLTTNT